MTRLKPLTRPTLPGSAVAWWVAVAALLAATGLAHGLTQHWLAQAAQAAQSERQLNRPPQGQLQRPLDRSDADRLTGALAAAEQTPQRVAELLALAQSLGLTLHGIRQTWGPAGSGDAAGLRQLQVTLLLHGPYSVLRTLVAKALQQDAGLALDTLLLETVAATDRPVGGAAAASLRAELQWSLLMRAPGASAP